MVAPATSARPSVVSALAPSRAMYQQASASPVSSDLGTGDYHYGRALELLEDPSARGKALYHLRRAAEEGHVEAALRRIDVLAKPPADSDPDAKRADYTEAFKAATEAAEAGIGGAWTRRGKMYCTGQGCDRSFENAAECYSRAERYGDMKGTGLLGMCYVTGTGVAVDKEYGMELLHKAAGRGDYLALQNIQYLYTDGKHIERDLDKANEWNHAFQEARRMLQHQKQARRAIRAAANADQDSKSGRARPDARKGEPRTSTYSGPTSHGEPSSAPVEGRRKQVTERQRHMPSNGTTVGASPGAGSKLGTERRRETRPSVVESQAVPSGERAGEPSERVSGSERQHKAHAPDSIHSNLSNNTLATSGRSSTDPPGLVTGDKSTRGMQASSEVKAEPIQQSVGAMSDREQSRESRKSTATAIAVNHSPELQQQLAKKEEELEQQKEKARAEEAARKQAEAELQRVTEMLHRARAENSQQESKTRYKPEAEQTTRTVDPLDRELSPGGRTTPSRSQGYVQPAGAVQQPGPSPESSTPSQPLDQQFTPVIEEPIEQSHSAAESDTVPSYSQVRSPTSTAQQAAAQRRTHEHQALQGLANAAARAMTQRPPSTQLSASDQNRLDAWEKSRQHKDPGSPQHGRAPGKPDSARVAGTPYAGNHASHSAPRPETDTRPSEEAQDARQRSADLAALQKADEDAGYTPSETAIAVRAGQARRARNEALASLSNSQDTATSSSTPAGALNEPVAADASEESSPRRAAPYNNGSRSCIAHVDHEGSGPSGAGDDGRFREIASGLCAEFPADLHAPGSPRAVYAFLDKVQEVSWKSPVAGQFLIQDGAMSLVSRAMVTFESERAIQERSIHAFIRLLRASDEGVRERLLLQEAGTRAGKDAPESHESSQHDEGNSADADRKTSRPVRSPIHLVIHSMRRHPDVMTLQLAGCCALMDFIKVSNESRVAVKDAGGAQVLVNALRLRSSCERFERLYLVHEMACRAIYEICVGSNTTAFKEAIGDAGGVDHIVRSIKRWMTREKLPIEDRISVTRHASMTLRVLMHRCEMNARGALKAVALPTLVDVLRHLHQDVHVALAAISAIAAIANAWPENFDRELDNEDILPLVHAALRSHINDEWLLRKSLECFCIFTSRLQSARTKACELGIASTCMFAIADSSHKPLTMKYAMSTIATMCSTESTAREQVFQLEGIKKITNVMTTSKNEARVLEDAAASAIANACISHKGNQEEALACDAPSAIVDALVTHGNDGPVIISCCSAVQNMALAESTELLDKLISLSAPKHVLTAMAQHSDNALIVLHTSRALNSMCTRHRALAHRLAHRSVVSILVQALTQHQPVASTVHAVLCAIRSMVARSQEAVMEFMAHRLPESLRGVFAHQMNNIPRVDHVIKVACATLNYCGHKQTMYKSEIGAVGIVEQLKDLALRAVDEDAPESLKPALSTLCTLVVDCPTNQDHFWEAGGVDGVLGILEKYDRDEAVVELCCLLLRHSCEEHSRNVEEVKMNRGMRTVQTVLAQHREAPHAISSASHALAVFCFEDSEMQKLAGDFDTIRAVTSAMDGYPDDADLQSAACRFLWAVARDNTRNQQRVMRCGGRTAVVHALERHPGDASLNEYGAHALLLVEGLDNVADAGSEPDFDTSGELLPPGTPGGRRRPNRFAGPLGWSRDGRRSSQDRRSSRDSRRGPDVDFIPEAAPDELEAPPTPRRRGRGRRNRAKNAVVAETEPEDATPQMHELHGGSYQPPDRTEQDPMVDLADETDRRRRSPWLRRLSRDSRDSRGSSRGRPTSIGTSGGESETPRESRDDERADGMHSLNEASEEPDGPPSGRRRRLFGLGRRTRSGRVRVAATDEVDQVHHPGGPAGFTHFYPNPPQRPDSDIGKMEDLDDLGLDDTDHYDADIHNA